MLKMYISFLLLLISLIMIFINHPLSMGLLILLQTLLICLISGMMINSYWFSYILFLTFLGGLLVLFIYVSSMASNEMFSKIFNMTLFILLMFMISYMMMMMMMIFKLNQLNWLNFNFNYEMNNIFYNFIHFNNENKINLTELYNSYSYLLMLLMINYLFFTLIVVVKITNIFYGPIRSNIF